MTNVNSGEHANEHLLEQYKLYVEMADKVSARRSQANMFFVSLLSAMLAFFSVAVERNILSGFHNIVLLAVAILGFIICFLWFVSIRSYRQLNSGKFKVIHEMEHHLPFACYVREWEILGKGKKYLRLTQIEQYVPFALAIPYMLLLLYSLFG